jgi:RP/EB family microtubule-associated protein
LNYSGEPYNASERRKGAQLFYIMGGNKVAAPNKAKGMPGGSGKIYSGKSSGTNNIGVPPASQAAPKKFGSSMGVGAGAGAGENNF